MVPRMDTRKEILLLLLLCGYSVGIDEKEGGCTKKERKKERKKYGVRMME
jgi:hypothetical protein